MIEPSVALFGDAYELVNGQLAGLLESARARYALLVDKKGFVLAHREALWAPNPPSLDSMATLIAGSAAATSALARLVGEVQFHELIQQGEDVGLYLESVSEQTLLAVVFDHEALVGKIKLFARRVVAELREILEQAAHSPAPVQLDREFSTSASALLDDLFGKDAGGSA
jgi:predicted regulator of Ras-like GTPase activity (Roadblock/LC7/MglB family)